MGTTKALIYTRYSPRREDQIETCVSTEVQAEACIEYADRQGYEVVGVFSDEQVSRNTLNRPGVGRMMNEIKRGYVVLAYHPDRVGSGIPAAVLQHEIDQKGARLEYAHGEFNGDSPEMVFLRSMMHAIAELNRATTGLKTSAAMKYRQGNGELMTRPGTCPYGTRVCPWAPGRTIPNHKERLIIREVLALRRDGKSYREISRALAARGRLSRQGNPLAITLVGKIVRDAAASEADDARGPAG